MRILPLTHLRNLVSFPRYGCLNKECWYKQSSNSKSWLLLTGHVGPQKFRTTFSMDQNSCGCCWYYFCFHWYFCCLHSNIICWGGKRYFKNIYLLRWHWKALFQIWHLLFLQRAAPHCEAAREVRFSFLSLIYLNVLPSNLVLQSILMFCIIWVFCQSSIDLVWII